MTQVLYPKGKSPWYPLDGRLGGPQSCSGRAGLEKNSQPLLGIEPQNPNHPARSPATKKNYIILEGVKCLDNDYPAVQSVAEFTAVCISVK
jgi:hypothetical protein